MRILVHSTTTDKTIRQDLGTPEYSYYFVLRELRPLLEKLGDVNELASPDEADAIYEESLLQGEPCVFLSFSPPHKTPVDLRCPTVPVFAWEYPDLPRVGDEDGWESNPRNDWAQVLEKVGSAITLSNHTAAAVKRRLGDDYPIAVIPSPVWDRLASARQRVGTRDAAVPRELQLTAEVADSRMLGLNVNGYMYPHIADGTDFDPGDDAILPPNPSWSGDGWIPPRGTSPDRCTPETSLVHEADESEPVSTGWDFPPVLKIRTRLEQVVYTTVLTPADGRKNWIEILTSFIWALREADDAVLIFKMTGGEKVWVYCQLIELLTKLSPFRCRVLVVFGYLESGEYESLITNTDFYVNASLCEGLCIPLMEYLSGGVPAIAPAHTSMADYITPGNAFVVASGDGAPMPWPHGDLQRTRTTRPRINWNSLMQAFRDSYSLAKTDRNGYLEMSMRAAQSMQAYCAADGTLRVLEEFLQRAGRSTPLIGEAATATGMSGNDQKADSNQC